jgi:succinyl-diaminopimelate desuccinylase
MLRMAATVPEPSRDVTYIFYECEEVDAERNGLGRLARTRPELLAGDFAVLCEPSGALIEGGCQGTIRVEVTVTGERAHSARAWMGSNAIHSAGVVLDILRSYEPAHPIVDGLEYREGLNAVRIEGGVANNVIPDLVTCGVNYRYSPRRTPEAAEARLRELAGADGRLTVVSNAPPAPVAIANPLLERLRAAGALAVEAKQAWTPVAEFAQAGVDAVNFGPGDPDFAHRRDEQVTVAAMVRSLELLKGWLAAA